MGACNTFFIFFCFFFWGGSSTELLWIPTPTLHSSLDPSLSTQDMGVGTKCLDLILPVLIWSPAPDTGCTPQRQKLKWTYPLFGSATWMHVLLFWPNCGHCLPAGDMASGSAAWNEARGRARWHSRKRASVLATLARCFHSLPAWNVVRDCTYCKLCTQYSALWDRQD